MHLCEPLLSGLVVHPTHILVHPRVHRAHRLKSAAIGPKVNGQQNLTGFVVFFTSIWWITVDMLVISVVERYFRLGLSTLLL